MVVFDDHVWRTTTAAAADFLTANDLHLLAGSAAAAATAAIDHNRSD